MNTLKGFRYHKGIKLGKFLKLNISKTGVGLSLGVRGLRYTVGPTGTHLTVGLPGTGIRYQRKVSDRKGFQYASLKKLKPGNRKKAMAAFSEKALPHGEAPPELPKPGLFAPKWEKELYKGVESFHEDDFAAAIDHLRQAAGDDEADLGALILLAFLLSESETTEERGEAITLLEAVVSTDQEFPSPMLAQYMADVELEIDITPQVIVTMPVDNALAATLLLVELYQDSGQFPEAIGLLEEVDGLISAEGPGPSDPLLTLSLAELYLVTQDYQAVVERVQVPDSIPDDVVLGTLFFYARALQEQNLHQAGVKVLNRCLRRKKGLNPDLLHACRLWRAMSFLKLKQQPRAREELERVLAEAGNAEIKQATMQALQMFWPQDFKTGPTPTPPKLTG